MRHRDEQRGCERCKNACKRKAGKLFCLKAGVTLAECAAGTGMALAGSPVGHELGTEYSVV